MFSIKKQNESLDPENNYLYLDPIDEETARWKILTQDQLDQMIENQEITEGCRLFKLDKEIKVEFKTVIKLS